MLALLCTLRSMGTARLHAKLDGGINATSTMRCQDLQPLHGSCIEAD